MRTERLAENYDLMVRWTQFPLHPETPPEGMALSDLFAGREDVLATMRKRLEALMAEEGLPYSDRTMTYNSRLAQEIGKWAETRPGGEAIHDLLMKAYFVEREDISDPDVLVRIAGEANLDEEEARQVLEERTFSSVVDEDWQRAKSLGVTAVPTFVADRHAVVGAQPYAVLERLVRAAGASPRDT